MAATAKTSASAAAVPVAKVQAAARKAGHACNEHDQRFIGYALDEAITRRRNVKDVKVEYGALRIRFDLKDDGELEVVEEKGDGTERKSDGSPAGDGQASQRAPQRPPGLDPSNASRTKEPADEPTDELRRLRERVEKAAAKRRRHKANRRTRDEAKRKQAHHYVTVPYGASNGRARLGRKECLGPGRSLPLRGGYTAGPRRRTHTRTHDSIIHATTPMECGR